MTHARTCSSYFSGRFECRRSWHTKHRAHRILWHVHRVLTTFRPSHHKPLCMLTTVPDDSLSQLWAVSTLSSTLAPAVSSSLAPWLVFTCLGSPLFLLCWLYCSLAAQPGQLTGQPARTLGWSRSIQTIMLRGLGLRSVWPIVPREMEDVRSPPSCRQQQVATSQVFWDCYCY